MPMEPVPCGHAENQNVSYVHSKLQQSVRGLSQTTTAFRIPLVGHKAWQKPQSRAANCGTADVWSE